MPDTQPEQDLPQQEPVAAPAEQTPVVPVRQDDAIPPMPHNLHGLGGWLIFFLVVFVLSGCGFITAFASLLVSNNDEATRTVSLLFFPFIAAGAIAAAALIALQKRLAVPTSIGTIALTGVYCIVALIVTYFDAVSRTSTRSYYYSDYVNPEATVPVLVAGILTSTIMSGFLALYFVISRRVKATLVK